MAIPKDLESNAFMEFLARYGPESNLKEAAAPTMVREIWGIIPDPWQDEVLERWWAGEPRMALAACHGPGKTAVGSWMAWGNLLTRFPQVVTATAPSKAQLEDALMKEMNVWGSRLPPRLRELYKITSTRVELIAAPEESFFTAATARAERPEGVQGKHADHVLVIIDEASGVPEQVFEASAGSMSHHNAQTVLLSNPTRTSGFFFDAFHRNQNLWWTRRISKDDSPRVTEEFADYIAAQYGRDSDAYRVRVEGEFPRTGTDTVVPYEIAAAAAERIIEPSFNEQPVWGVDPGRHGDDATGLVMRRGRVVTEVHEWQIPDLMQLAGAIKRKYDDAEQRPSRILIDEIGMGYGLLDRLREVGLPVKGINVSESPSQEDRFMRLRDELWWGVREWLEGMNVSLPETTGEAGSLSDKLLAELTAPTYAFSSSGKIKVEGKIDMKKRGHDSPNLADALCLTFAIGAAALRHGSRYGGERSSWNEPLKRNLKMV